MFGLDVQMTPHFAFWTCEDCEAEIKKEDCYGNGAFCAMNEKNLNTTGQTILDEDLRQYCIHQEYQDTKKESLWWDYITEFHSECYNEVTEECSKNSHKKAGLDWKKTQNCVEATFIGRGDKYRQTNVMFDAEQEYYQKFGPSFFPGVVINNRTYMGSLDPENVFAAICAGFKDSPKECKAHAIGLGEATGISTSRLLLIIFGLVGINILLILCYRRFAKKEVNDQMQMHINSAVSQYFALQDKDPRQAKPLVQ